MIFIRGTMLFQDKAGKAKTKESQRKCFTVQRTSWKSNITVAITQNTHISGHGRCVTNNTHACAPTQMHTPNIRGVHSLQLKPQATRSPQQTEHDLPLSQHPAARSVVTKTLCVCMCVVVLVGVSEGRKKRMRDGWWLETSPKQPFIKRPSTDTNTNRQRHSFIKNEFNKITQC